MLTNFTEEERLLLVALPYRVGLWVSRCDETGGAHSEEVEIAALRNIVTGFVEDFLKAELVETIMRETVARKDLWPEWEKDTDNVLEECTRAVEIVSSQLDEKYTTAFKSNLMEIGMTVALAFREFHKGQPLAEKLKVYMRYYRQRLLAMMRKEQILSLDEYLNISSTEHQALMELAEALRLEYREGAAVQGYSYGAGTADDVAEG